LQANGETKYQYSTQGGETSGFQKSDERKGGTHPQKVEPKQLLKGNEENIKKKKKLRDRQTGRTKLQLPGQRTKQRKISLTRGGNQTDSGIRLT